MEKWTVLKHLRKLKILSVNEEGLEGVDPGSIIAHIPHLQTLILYRTGNNGGNFGFNFAQQPQQPARPIFKHYGKTVVMTNDYLRTRDLESVQKIGPLLKKTNYAYYFQAREHNGQEQEFNSELLDYLFAELKLDINCSTVDTSNPFVADLLAPNRFALGFDLASTVCSWT